jgi:hypothetical protein
VQNIKNWSKLFSKSFKICPNRDQKKAPKTKIGPKYPLPNMRIEDNNRI